MPDVAWFLLGLGAGVIFARYVLALLRRLLPVMLLALVAVLLISTCDSASIPT